MTTFEARVAAQLRRLTRDADDRIARGEPADEALAWIVRECRDLAGEIERPGYHSITVPDKEPR